MNVTPRLRLRTTCLLLALTAPAPLIGQDGPIFEALDVEELPPAPEEVLDEPVLSSPDTAPEPELIRERYDNRRVRIEREVIQDAEQNYINHGRWKQWDEQGNVSVEGQYHYNLRNGVWTRIYRTRDVKLLNVAPFNQGQLPLVSQANFQDGELDGKWVIYDLNKQKLCEWEFSRGRRHGTSAWWYLNGQKMREISYEDGSIDGELREWDRSGKLVTRDQYDDGRRLDTKTDYFPNRAKRWEGTVLHPQLVLDHADEWESCTLATYKQDGTPVKHGVWTSWYANGQRKLEGRYEHDTPAGEFVWWHPNGQRSLVAAYKDGKKHGQWTWWHANGQKSIQGRYANDDPTSDWLWWNEVGKVAQRADFSDPEQRQILAMPNTDSVLGSPSASKTKTARIFQ